MRRDPIGEPNRQAVEMEQVQLQVADTNLHMALIRIARSPLFDDRISS